MNIMYQFNKIFFCINLFALEITFENTALAIVFFIVRLGIAIEKMRKTVADEFGINTINLSRVYKRSSKSFIQLFLSFYPNEKMKMIGHQTISECLSNWNNVFDVPVQEFLVVVFIVK